MVNRDGAAISLWQDKMEPYSGGSNRADKQTIYDVVIVGGGITGISTGLLLQRSGIKCLLLEAANLGFGTTGGTTAHLNTLLDTPYKTISKNFNKEKAELVAQAASEAINLIRNNVLLYDIDCGFEEADAYLFARNEKQEKELEEIVAASKEAGLELDYSKEIPVPIPFVKAVRVKGQAKFNPLVYLYALARAFEKAGGIIEQHCRVTGVEHNEIIEAETNKGIFKGRDLIYATHIPPGVNLLHLRCVPYRSYAMALTLADNNYPAGLSYDMEDPYHYYRTQKVKGRNYLIAGGKDHKTAHSENTNHHFLELESHIRSHFNIDKIGYKWSSQYFEPADGLPYIGHLPGHPYNIYVATGFGGNGMVYSSVAALIFKDIFLKKKSGYSEVFDPNRIKPVAGFINFIKHNADVARQFVGKLFSREDLQQLADLAPGEAKVVIFENKKLALYKSDEGELHAISPVCTHLKCEVKWNAAETSWDCPCHGARYSYDGKVLTGPADVDLEKIEIRDLVK